jgi:hypothetical protein
VKDISTLKEGSAVTEQSQPEWRTMGDDEDTGIWAIGLLMFAAIVMIMAGARSRPSPAWWPSSTTSS